MNTDPNSVRYQQSHQLPSSIAENSNLVKTSDSDLPIVYGVTGDSRALDSRIDDHLPAHRRAPEAVRQQCPLPTVRELYAMSIQVRPDLWLTIEDLCKEYGLNRSTIHVWLKKGFVSAVWCRLPDQPASPRIYRPNLDSRILSLSENGRNRNKWAIIASKVRSIGELKTARIDEAKQAESAEYLSRFTPEEFRELAFAAIG